MKNPKTFFAVTEVEDKIVHYKLEVHSKQGAGEEKGMCLLGEQIELPTPSEFSEWFIWSNEHGAWWAPEHKGYVQSREEAGRYSFAEACMIVEGANRHLPAGATPNEAMILADV